MWPDALVLLCVHAKTAQKLLFGNRFNRMGLTGKDKYTMNKHIVLGVLVATLVGGGAFSKETINSTEANEKMTMTVTPQQREKMAEFHQKMADCLRSKKLIDECRKEMKAMHPMRGHMRGMMDGKIGEPSASSAQPPKDLISMDQAKEIAIKAAPGMVKNSVLEFEKNQWVYSFDIQDAANQIHEILVDAKTGKIIESRMESAAEAAKETRY
jgi:uncharacterized membrane protein YkoI